MEFVGFPKIPRLFRDIIITEKIDGTNACVVVSETGEVKAQSRSRIITPDDDNFGFAAWVQDNVAELRTLGPGYHFGEWWGRGIQRGYGMPSRYFSLFHVKKCLPGCCYVVPQLYKGPFSESVVWEQLERLKLHGSFASLGYKDPEGIIVYHTAANKTFKVTIDDSHKGGAE